MKLIHAGTSGPLPTSSYHLHVHGRRVGYIQVRHKPSKGAHMPKGSETHIAYGIDVSERRKGYGREILRLGLIEARKIGLKEIFIGADTANVASWRIIEANGGQLVKTFRRLDTSEECRHYRVSL